MANQDGKIFCNMLGNSHLDFVSVIARTFKYKNQLASFEISILEKISEVGIVLKKAATFMLLLPFRLQTNFLI